MKKSLLFSLLMLFAFAGANAQLLYKVSGKGLDKPSYIIGTYHLAPATFVDSIPGARTALESVEQVCGEVVMSEMLQPENLQKVQAAMLLPDGQELETIFSPAEMERINAYMKSIIGADLSNPMVKGSMGKMSPAALASQLQMVQYIKLTPGFNPNEMIDSYFQTEGARMGKSIAGLETIDFQIGVLYTGTPLERQKEKLLCVVDNSEFTLMVMKKVASAYFSQDMAAIKEAFDEKMGNSCDSTPEEDNALIYDRNVNWVASMPTIMSEKSTLFVVGAGHLPGERGVIELLRKEGYTVEAVNSPAQAVVE